MSVAIVNQRVFCAENVDQLAKKFPKANLLLNDARDLALAYDERQSLMDFLRQLLPEPVISQLRRYGNHTAAWYNGLEMLAEPINPAAPVTIIMIAS